MKKVLIILGHPVSKSYCGALANAYAKGAKSSGSRVRRINLGDINFDPVARMNKSQKLEPSLLKAQKDITWAEHLVIIYPTWWGSVPALLKGFLDRTFSSNFAFRFKKTFPFWDGLLKGRSARVITTMDSPKIGYLFFGRPGHSLMKRAILGFCGLKPVKITTVTKVKYLGEAGRKKWLDRVEQLGSLLK